MNGVQGQATVEYAGLLALAATLGATLALIAGPPLVDAVRGALVNALSAAAARPAAVVATAADIADVQSALLPTDEAVSPDAALLALGRRHGAARGAEVADAVLLAAAREAVPWIGAPRTYRAWRRAEDGPYVTAETASGDRDVEQPTASADIDWVTVAEQREQLAGAFAHDTNKLSIAWDLVGLVPGGGALRAVRPEARLAHVPVAARLIDKAHTGKTAIHLFNTDDGDIPAGVRAGDVAVAWPVHRTFWRAGRPDPRPRVDLGPGGTHALTHDYVHLVYLRPGAGGLQLVAEGIGAIGT